MRMRSGERSAEAKHVLHRVESGRLAHDPARGANRAAREGIPAVRAMGQLEPLAQGPEGHGVLAHHVARALGEYCDLLAHSLARQTVATVHRDLVEITAEGLV